MKKYRQQNKEQIKAQREGYYQQHKEQIKAQRKDHYQQNKEKEKAQRKDYYQQNKEQENQYSKDYRQQHKEQINQYNKDYHEKNKEQIKARMRIYYQQNPKQREAYILFRKAIRNGSIIRPNSCSYCPKECIPEGHHEDYSQPLEVIWLCRGCHQQWHVDRAELIVGLFTFNRKLT